MSAAADVSVPKFALNSDDPAERFLAMVAMALDSVADAKNPIDIIINVSAATISRARCDCYVALASERVRLH